MNRIETDNLLDLCHENVLEKWSKIISDNDVTTLKTVVETYQQEWEAIPLGQFETNPLYIVNNQHITNKFDYFMGILRSADEHHTYHLKKNNNLIYLPPHNETEEYLFNINSSSYFKTYLYHSWMANYMRTDDLPRFKEIWKKEVTYKATHQEGYIAPTEYYLLMSEAFNQHASSIYNYLFDMDAMRNEFLSLDFPNKDILLNKIEDYHHQFFSQKNPFEQDQIFHFDLEIIQYLLEHPVCERYRKNFKHLDYFHTLNENIIKLAKKDVDKFIYIVEHPLFVNIIDLHYRKDSCFREALQNNSSAILEYLLCNEKFNEEQTHLQWLQSFFEHTSLAKDIINKLELSQKLQKELNSSVEEIYKPKI